MMQAKARRSKENPLEILGYNNGFGMEETDREYHERLFEVGKKVSTHVLDHGINIVGLCEGPITEKGISSFHQGFLENMPEDRKDRFILESVHTDKTKPNWGLLLIRNAEEYPESKLSLSEMPLPGCENRFQTWELQGPSGIKRVALTHLPFSPSKDEHKSVRETFSPKTLSFAIALSQLLKKFERSPFILMGDFNFNPFLMGEIIRERHGDKVPHSNSILLLGKDEVAVTVDGILYSGEEKRRKMSATPVAFLLHSLRKEHKLSLESGSEIDPHRSA